MGAVPHNGEDLRPQQSVERENMFEFVKDYPATPPGGGGTPTKTTKQDKKAGGGFFPQRGNPKKQTPPPGLAPPAGVLKKGCGGRFFFGVLPCRRNRPAS